MERVEIRTDDGLCPAYTFALRGKRPLPAVLLYMDGIGIRPAMLEMGERLANAGYYVLLPDLFYRAGPYEPMDAKTVFSDPEKRKILMSKFVSTVSIASVMRDTRAFLHHLAECQDVKQPKVGTTGYCMGARFSLCAAGHYPERIAAAACFHGSNMATDAPDSPHLMAANIKARVYVAGGSEDANFPEAQRRRLDDALAAAGVQRTVEIWPARHGWVPTDTPVHDPVQAERHWKTLLELFEQALKP